MEPGRRAIRRRARGTVTQVPAEQCGDLLLRDRNGNWTYQFAVVVDDMRHGVDLVIRGEDLLSSTGRQIRLARMLGRERPPVFLHHPLIRKPDGAKLSKSSGDTGIAELREAGVRPEAVLGEAAWLTGLIGERRAGAGGGTGEAVLCVHPERSEGDHVGTVPFAPLTVTRCLAIASPSP